MLRLKPATQSVRSARAFAAELIDGRDVELRETVVLLVSELVSNAVLHGGPYGPDDTVGFEVAVDEHCVRVDVTDVGAGEPHVANGDVERPSGRGLLLVEALASRWGYDRLPVGKKVWFELLTTTRGDADG